MTARLVLIRGLPGSGKSTIAKMLDGFVHLEADMFFTKENGEYIYEREKIKAAHEWCQAQAFSLLSLGGSVVVSNTFTRHREMAPYFEIADALGIKPSVIVATGNFKNVHDVPDEVIAKMRERWEA